MKKLKTIKLIKVISLVILSLIILEACNEDDTTAISNDLRILKVTINGEDLAEVTKVGNTNLAVTLVFSHSLNTSVLEDALSISGSPDFSVSYDETNSFVTLTFERLEFETEYTINVPAGEYGTKGEMLKSPYTLSFTTNAFVPPIITLSADASRLFEGETATLTAELNKATINDVTANLIFEGTAEGSGVDFSLEAESLTIPLGNTSVSIALTAINDAEIEGEEIINITISNLENAVEASPQQLALTINDEPAALALKGVMAIRWATETDGSSGKAVHLIAKEDIADLSAYSLGIPNNGGGTDGIEFTLPAISVAAGENILVAREPSALETYFGATCFAEFDHVIQTEEMNQNGDDAIELYKGTAVIETYGDANVDGTDQSWEYSGSWAYKLGDDWINAPVDCADGSTSSIGSDCVYPLCDNPLALKGVMAILWDGSGTNGGKAVHLVANKDIADLSQYSIGVANNGGGTDGIEYTFPNMTVSEGDHILLAREPDKLAAYFGDCFSNFDHVLQADAMNQNGDDAIELFDGTTVIETFADVNVDGTGQAWEYSGSWAYKVASKWTYGGVDCAASATTNQNSSCSYLFCE